MKKFKGYAIVKYHHGLGLLYYCSPTRWSSCERDAFFFTCQKDMTDFMVANVNLFSSIYRIYL